MARATAHPTRWLSSCRRRSGEWGRVDLALLDPRVLVQLPKHLPRLGFCSRLFLLAPIGVRHNLLELIHTLHACPHLLGRAGRETEPQRLTALGRKLRENVLLLPPHHDFGQQAPKLSQIRCPCHRPVSQSLSAGSRLPGMASQRAMAPRRLHTVGPYPWSPDRSDLGARHSSGARSASSWGILCRAAHSAA